MTIISCEFCGPIRVAPHDVNCPTRNETPQRIMLGIQPNPEYVRYVEQQMAALPPAVGLVRRGRAVEVVVAPRPEPLITRNPDHETMTGRFGAVCKCGYDPRETHPEAGRGQLFAYVGQHIREASRDHANG